MILPVLIEAPTLYHFAIAISRFVTLEADDLGEIVRELVKTLLITAPNYLLLNGSSWKTMTGVTYRYSFSF
jgi:hypothetical protein